jgi:hypothetical protein
MLLYSGTFCAICSPDHFTLYCLAVHFKLLFSGTFYFLDIPHSSVLVYYLNYICAFSVLREIKIQVTLTEEDAESPTGTTYLPQCTNIECALRKTANIFGTHSYRFQLCIYIDKIF